MNVVIRTALAILFALELVVGAWNAFLPGSFYTDFPTVDLTPPFSEHYARDFGWATLGIALLLGIALARPRTHYVVPAALAAEVAGVLAGGWPAARPIPLWDGEAGARMAAHLREALPRLAPAPARSAA